MTERRALKKKLSKLKSYARSLPRLIDCSNVYGDGYYIGADIAEVEWEIKETERRIAEIDKANELLNAK